MNEKVIEVENLVKNFGNFTALNNVNFTINKGEVFGFIGPNGAGKSTTIRVLLGILQATSGTAKVFGMNPWENTAETHSRIAYVPGDVNLWPNMTGGEVIDFFGKIRGGINEERRAKLVKEFELDTTKKCRTYSKGNRQKVALISAFASDAELYILDEPTSGLDPLMAKVFFKWVNEFKKQGKTVLLSSHILQEVEGLCDRISIIRQGRIVESGTISEMRKYTKVNVRAVTAAPLKGLEKIAGVSNIVRNENETTFQVDSDKISQIIEFIAPLKPTKFESSPPSLEDLFMRYYDETEGATK